jgi:hypothetical protein
MLSCKNIQVCDLPFVFFSDPELMPLLAGTLVAACYGCEQNKFMVQQELSVDMLLSLLRSCRNAAPATQLNSNFDNIPTDESIGSNQSGILKHNRPNGKGTRASFGKSGALGNGTKSSRTRSLRDGKATKNTDEAVPKYKQFSSETSHSMLHCRFPHSFLDKVEQFFSADIANGVDEV